jgi:acetyl esterase/lipase
VLSSVVHTHAVLVKHGVEADRHVWEGMGHAFLLDSDHPQSVEAYGVITRFFDRHLGAAPAVSEKQSTSRRQARQRERYFFSRAE